MEKIQHNSGLSFAKIPMWSGFRRSLGSTNVLSDRRRQVERGVNSLCGFAAIGIILLSTILYKLVGNPQFITDALIGITLLILAYTSNRLGEFELANVLFYLTINAIIFRSGLYVGRPQDMPLGYCLLFLLIFIVFEEKLTRLFCILVILARAILYEFHPGITSIGNGLVPGRYEDAARWLIVGFIAAFILLIFYLSAVWMIQRERLEKKRAKYVQQIIHDTQNAYSPFGDILEFLKYANDTKIPLSNEAEL